MDLGQSRARCGHGPSAFARRGLQQRLKAARPYGGRHRQTFREAAEEHHCDGVIAANTNGTNPPRAFRSFISGGPRQVSAIDADTWRACRRSVFLGLLHGNVADVFHRMPSAFRRCWRSATPQCGRAHVHTAAALAEVIGTPMMRIFRPWLKHAPVPLKTEAGESQLAGSFPGVKL